MVDHIALAAQYQAAVLDGSLDACRWVRLACERNRKDLDRQETEGFPYRFDPKAARSICAFAELLPHIKGPLAFVTGTDESGRQLWNTIVLEPWQCWILTTLFGWVHAKTGLRRFRSGLILIPRKNAKSTLGASIALYMLTADGESGAEVYSAATTRDQAKVVGEIAWEMAKRSVALREWAGIRMGAKTTRVLEVASTASRFMPLSADAHSLDGLNVSCAIVDELHAHKTRAVWDVLDTATGARKQSLLLAITTAGVEIGGICHEKLGYLEKVLDGVATDETYFGINYTIDQGDNYWEESAARKCNPNNGVSVDLEDIARKMNAARHSPAALNDKLTKHFNVWIRAESPWMSATDWQSCSSKDLTLESLKHHPCWIGVDLGEVRDYSAIVLLFKTGPESYVMMPSIYVPEEAIDTSPIAELSGWVRDGHIISTSGSEADYTLIQTDLLQFYNALNVKEIDFDRKSARLMMQVIRAELEKTLGRDRAELIVVDVDQSLATMDPAMKTTERLVTGKRIQHTGNLAFAWMIANIVIERNHKDEMYPRKAGGKDSANKIDGPVALFTCLSRAMSAPIVTRWSGEVIAV